MSCYRKVRKCCVAIALASMALCAEATTIGTPPTISGPSTETVVENGKTQEFSYTVSNDTTGTPTTFFLTAFAPLSGGTFTFDPDDLSTTFGIDSGNSTCLLTTSPSDTHGIFQGKSCTIMFWVTPVDETSATVLDSTVDTINTGLSLAYSASEELGAQWQGTVTYQTALRLIDPCSDPALGNGCGSGSGSGTISGVVQDGRLVQVPEPATLALLGVGLAGIGFVVRRSRAPALAA